ncbi:hypothetical protein [Streptomyces longispororuber]|uniref:hypothetical protein n=1 Tax=Streptomyces longispororuber TaxID=68230 RepID=UPI003701D25B
MAGGYSGLGLETARALTAAGALPARRPDVARADLEEVRNCEVIAMDLTDIDSGLQREMTLQAQIDRGWVDEHGRGAGCAEGAVGVRGNAFDPRAPGCVRSLS